MHVVAGAQQPETWSLPPALRQRVLFDRATAASYLGGAYVLDAQGHLKASQSGVAEPGISFADRPIVIVVGSEGKGLSRLVTENCDAIVSIPISSDTESLNAGIAVSVALYEVAKLRAES